MPHYEVTILERIPVQGGPAIFQELSRVIPLGGESSGGGGLSWSRELCSEGFMNVATQPESLPESVQTRIIDMANNPLEMVVIRDGVVRQHGPMVSWQIEGNTLILQARGMPYYLRYMTLIQDKSYIETDQALIVKDLIDTFQAEDYGNYRIDTSAITAHGVLRDREYLNEDMINIAKEIHAIGEADNGFDVDIDYSSRELQLIHPQKGTDRSNSVFLDSRGLINPNFAYSLAAGQFGSSAVATGRTSGGSNPIQVEETPSVRQNFGRSFVSGNVMGVSTVAEIAGYARQIRDLANNPYFVPSREYISVTGTTVDDFDVGDTVSFIYDPGFGEVQISQDVKNINVSVSPGGDEKLNVEFV